MGLVVVHFINKVNEDLLLKKAQFYNAEFQKLLFTDDGHVSYDDIKDYQALSKLVKSEDKLFQEFGIFDFEGKIIYSSVLGLIGDNVPKDWVGITEGKKDYILDIHEDFGVKDYHYIFPYRDEGDSVIAGVLVHFDHNLSIEVIKNYLGKLDKLILFVAAFIGLSVLVYAMIASKIRTYFKDQLKIFTDVRVVKSERSEPVFLSFKDKIKSTQRRINQKLKELENYEDF